MAEATYETNSLGYKLKFRGPGSVEEYDQKAGKLGTCLEDAVDNTIYRSTLPEWQDAFADALEKLTGQTRQVNADATAAAKSRAKDPAKVKDILETVRVFHARVTAGMSDEDKKALAEQAQTIADGIVVDPSPSKRQAGPGKPFLAKADSWLTLDDNALEAKITPALREVPDFELERGDDGRPDRNSLARLIERYVDTMV